VQIGSLNEPAFSGNDRLIDARGTFSIPQLKELIEGAELYLGVDSGPAHVASATETDMIVLYTSVREEYRRPLRKFGQFVAVAADIDCYGCHALNPVPCTTFICNRGDIECVNRFNPQQVASQAIALIKE
jgi:ADP-heptose:LPS heptosyltransferase